MGCGTSRGIGVVGGEQTGKNGMIKGVVAKDVDTNGVCYHEVFLKDKSIETFTSRGSLGRLSTNEVPSYDSTPALTRAPSEADIECGDANGDVTPTKQTQDCQRKVSDPLLQERINALKELRRRKSECDEAIPFNGNANSSMENSNSKWKTTPLSPRLRSSSPASLSPSKTEPDGLRQVNSPFGQRSRLKLTDSQREFFLMLDEKIAQGKDYCSEDEKSISSLVSRRSTGRRSLRHVFTPLHMQHGR